MIKHTATVVVCSLLLGFGLRPRAEAPSISELRYLYRDDHDERVVAEVVARLEGERLTVEIRSQGPWVEPPAGYEGFRGENIQTARELAWRLFNGSLRAVTLEAASDELAVAETGRFRIRRYDSESRKLEEASTADELIRIVRYTARFRPGGSGKPFRTEFQVAGVPRLILHGRRPPERGKLLRFERRTGYEQMPRVRTSSPARPQEVPGGESTDRLIEQLGDESVQVRDRAQKELIARGPGILNQLEKHVEDKDFERRARVRAAIRTIRLEEVIGRLSGPDVEKRAEALRDLEKQVEKDPLAYMRENPDERFVLVLTDIVLFDVGSARRNAVQEALIPIGTPKIFPALLWILRNPSDHQVDHAVPWLSLKGDLTLIPELEKLRKAGKGGASEVLKNIHSRFPEGKPQEPTEWKPIDPSVFVRAISRGKTSGEKIRGIRAVITGLSWDAEARMAVRAALEDSEEEVRYEAATAFTHLPAGGAVQALGNRLKLKDEVLRIRQMSAVALGRSREGSAKRILLDSLQDGSSDLKITVAGALGDTGDKALIDLLRAHASKEKEVQVQAALERAADLIEAANK